LLPGPQHHRNEYRLGLRKVPARAARGAHIILKEVPDATLRGASFEGERIIRIEEKPANPESPYAVIGIYTYDATVFDRIRTLKPSARGEFWKSPMSNNQYLREGLLSYSILEGWWTDAGTFDSLLRANQLVADGGANKLETRGTAPGGHTGAVSLATQQVR
jgi:glucose-1-phosphate thymidylyltransferase